MSNVYKSVFCIYSTLQAKLILDFCCCCFPLVCVGVTVCHVNPQKCCCSESFGGELGVVKDYSQLSNVFIQLEEHRTWFIGKEMIGNHSSLKKLHLKTKQQLLISLFSPKEFQLIPETSLWKYQSKSGKVVSKQHSASTLKASLYWFSRGEWINHNTTNSCFHGKIPQCVQETKLTTAHTTWHHTV